MPRGRPETLLGPLLAFGRSAIGALAWSAVVALASPGCGSPGEQLPPASSPSPSAGVADAPDLAAADLRPRSAPPLPDPIVDLHVDTVTQLIEQKITWESSLLEASLPSLQAGGVNVIVQAAWIPRGAADPRGVALRKIHGILNMVRRSHGAAAVVRGPGQLEAVLRSGRIAVVIALEGGTALRDAETLRELAGLGVSMVGLTWTEASPYADSSAEPRPGDAGGLTAAGHAMVELANDLGVMLDVSHMSDRATEQTVVASRAPVLASHSNARALADTPRNLSDALARQIAAKGGLVGVMFHGPFLRTAKPARRADAVAHVQHFVTLLGAEHVGLGSDWDGVIQSAEGLGRASMMAPLRVDLAAAGLSAETVRAVQGGSFLRFWRRVEDARRPASPSAALPVVEAP